MPDFTTFNNTDNILTRHLFITELGNRNQRERRNKNQHEIGQYKIKD